MCELLRANLYEFQKYNRESGDAPYFTLPRVQSIARQVSTASPGNPLSAASFARRPRIHAMAVPRGQ